MIYILISCQSVTFVDGYPVLRKIFRHLARTPRKFPVWIEAKQLGWVHFILLFSTGEVDQSVPLELKGAGQDVADIHVPSGFEGSISIVMIDVATGAERAVREVHFGGLSWLSPQ